MAVAILIGLHLVLERDSSFVVFSRSGMTTMPRNNIANITYSFATELNLLLKLGLQPFIHTIAKQRSQVESC
jgi:hypothetical protein